MVKIIYWIQDTEETGHWHETDPMTMDQAERMLELGWMYNPSIEEVKN